MLKQKLLGDAKNCTFDIYSYFFCLERNIELCNKLDELQTATIERLINENCISQQLRSNIYRFGYNW